MRSRVVLGALVALLATAAAVTTSTAGFTAHGSNTGNTFTT
ncbi:MAG: hypothetical protein QOF29_2958, partial [bacterium]